ncbi:MAG: YqeG family HAD IIIA-type phosphatase [Clostridia bacterium]|nr:YqeG family HAD IIIA-type phosphatase [Clostridia bacterium]
MIRLRPRYRVSHYTRLTAEALQRMGAKALVCDIDNTLAAHDVGTADSTVCAWLESLHQAGIPVAVVSNNGPQRVELFNASLGLPCLPKAGKPKPRAYLNACRLLNSDPATTAFLGDQLFTDMAGANRAGLISVLTEPLPFPEPFFIRLKRKAEAPFLWAWAKKGH